jgi:hypothetical protein
MNKKLLILIAAILVILPVVASCGRTSTTGNTKLPADTIPHVVDVRFENCMACHVADQLAAAKPLPHIGMNYTNKDCISAACHKLSGTTTPPVTTTTTPPVSTPPGTGTGTTSTPPASSTPAATLTDKPIAITTHNLAALKAYGDGTPNALCQMCHAPGTTNSNPYAPSWDGKANGSTANPGVYAIAPGSVQDHTPYKVEECTKAGCHALPTS